MFRWSAAPAFAVALTASAAVPAAAQVNATVVMRSGEQHQGTNVQVRTDKNDFSLRKSVNDQLRVGVNEVAYVDFGGTPDVQVTLSGSQHAVVLRNGTVLRGQVTEMGHANLEDQSTEYLVSFRDSSGEMRRLPVNQVARVYFTNPTSTSTGTAGQGSGGAVSVSSRQQWTPTGLTVQKGETVRFTTTGQVQLSTDSNDTAQAAGAASQRLAPGAPLPRIFAGALIGRIGQNGQPFAIGNQTSVPMPETGQLFLGVNDDNLGDNQGEFRVEIQRTNQGSPIRRRR
jgi:hypothetical protein